MVLCEAKHNAIVQWHNSVSTHGSNVASLADLKDGDILQKHIKEMFLESRTKVVELQRKSISFLKEADSKANFKLVKKYIDDSYHVKSEELISYEECMAGNTLEIAKVSIFTLCISVTHLLQKSNDSRLALLTHLDALTQYEIMECMTFITDRPAAELTRIEFQRLLSRAAKTKERSIRLSNSPVTLETPRVRGRPRKLADFVMESSPAATCAAGDEPPVLLQMLESPKMKVWSTIAVKDREISALHQEVDLLSNKNIDLRCTVQELRTDLHKKTDEIKKLKEEYSVLREEVDTLHQSMEAQNKMTSAKVSSSELIKVNKIVETLEIENTVLRQEVETWKITYDELCLKHQEQKALLLEQLPKCQVQLQISEAEKESIAKANEKLQDELKDLKEEVSILKVKIQDQEKEFDHSKYMDATPEILGDIIEEDYRMLREKLLNEEFQNAHLRRMLEEKTALCNQQQALLDSQHAQGSVPENAEAENPDVFCDTKNQISTEQMWNTSRENDVKKNMPKEILGHCDPQNNGNGSESPPDLEHDSRSVDYCTEGISSADVMSTMYEIILLAKQVFSSHVESQTLDLPSIAAPLSGIVSFPDSANYVKHLLREVLKEASSSSSGGASVKNAPFETKSDEVSLDSGVNLCANGDLRSLPSVQEYSAQMERGAELLGSCGDIHVQSNPFQPQTRLAAENESLLNMYKDAMKLKEEAEKSKEKLLVDLKVLTESSKEATKKLAMCELKLGEMTAGREQFCNKYKSLKKYVVKLESDLHIAVASWEKYKKKEKEKQEELLISETRVKELQVSIEHYKELRQRLSSQVDVLHHECNQLQEKNRKLELELETEKMNLKELILRNQQLQIEKDWAYQGGEDWRRESKRQTINKIVVGMQHNGHDADTSGACVRLEAHFSNKGNDSILSGSICNKSLHSTFVAEDEPLYLSHSELPRMDGEGKEEEHDKDDFMSYRPRYDEQMRLQELRNRNNRYKPHLRSCYLIETQGYRNNDAIENGRNDSGRAERHVNRSDKKHSGRRTPAKKKARRDGPEADVPPPKHPPGIFKTPKGLHRIVQKWEEDRKRAAGIKKPRIKL